MKTNSSETNTHAHQLMEYGNVGVFSFDTQRAEIPSSGGARATRVLAQGGRLPPPVLPFLRFA